MNDAGQYYEKLQKIDQEQGHAALNTLALEFQAVFSRLPALQGELDAIRGSSEALDFQQLTTRLEQALTAAQGLLLEFDLLPEKLAAHKEMERFRQLVASQLTSRTAASLLAKFAEVRRQVEAQQEQEAERQAEALRRQKKEEEARQQAITQAKTELRQLAADFPRVLESFPLLRGRMESLLAGKGDEEYPLAVRRMASALEEAGELLRQITRLPAKIRQQNEMESLLAELFATLGSGNIGQLTGRFSALLEEIEQQEARLAAERARWWQEIEMVEVPGGSFKMGDIWGGGWSNEKPVHTVTIQPFLLGKYPVTQGLWQAVMGSNPSCFQKGENYPVENVSWHDVQEFLQHLNRLSGREYRLPSEAEWEYAARSGGGSQRWPGTDSKGELHHYAWYTENSGKTTHPVGEKRPNALGLHDMAGNVQEWCEDVWHKTYDGAPQDGSAWLSGGDGVGRVIRGGSWGDDPEWLRAASRGWYWADDRSFNLGFRLSLVQQ